MPKFVYKKILILTLGLWCWNGGGGPCGGGGPWGGGGRLPNPLLMKLKILFFKFSNSPNIPPDCANRVLKPYQMVL